MSDLFFHKEVSLQIALRMLYEMPYMETVDNIVKLRSCTLDNDRIIDYN